MTWNLTLDILLVLLIILFAPIGYMRGPVKEILVTLGVVFGGLLVSYWARPWGQDLDYYFDLGDDPGAFVVAMAILMSTTFIGGYGLGLLMASWDHSVPGRVLGALISTFNGALLVGFSLQYVRLFLLSDANEESLEASYVVDFLVNEIGWLIFGAALVTIPVLIFGLATRRKAYDFGVYEDEPDYGDDYPDYDVDYGDYDDDYDETPSPLSVVTRREQRQPDSESGAETRILPPRVPAQSEQESQPLYKSDPQTEADDEAVSLTRPLTFDPSRNQPKERGEEAVSSDTDPEMTIYLPSDAEQEDQPEDQQEEQVDEELQGLPEGYFRCSNCQAVLPPGTKVCTVCGQKQD